MQYNIIARKVRVRTYVGDEVVRCTCSGVCVMFVYYVYDKIKMQLAYALQR